MMWRDVVSVLVCLQLLAGFCSGVTVTQKERFKIIQMGIQPSLDCNHDDNSYFTILWYKQESNSAETQLQLVGYSVQGSDPQMTMTTYKIERPNVTHASLLVPPGQAADSAVYFCAASKGTVSTSCLKLHMNVGVVLPSPFLNHKYTPMNINCLLSNVSKEDGKHSSCL